MQLISHFNWIILCIIVILGAGILFLLYALNLRLIRLNKKFTKIDKLYLQMNSLIQMNNENSEYSSPQLRKLAEVIDRYNFEIIRVLKEISEQNSDITAQLQYLQMKTSDAKVIDQSTSIDYKTKLEAYLNVNFHEHNINIMQLLSTLEDVLKNPILLKDHIINLTMLTGFRNMSDTRKNDFCNTINDYLSRINIQIFAPISGIDYDKSIMKLNKQLSASNKVTQVLYFGVIHNDICILKADVNVG